MKCAILTKMNAGTHKKLPVDLLELYRFMENAARTFEPYYDAWEFWNEPELGSMTKTGWRSMSGTTTWSSPPAQVITTTSSRNAGFTRRSWVIREASFSAIT